MIWFDFVYIPWQADSKSFSFYIYPNNYTLKSVLLYLYFPLMEHASPFTVTAGDDHMFASFLGESD